MSACGQPLTSAQKRTLRDYDFFIDEEQLHLSEQATLSKANAVKIQEMLKEARDNDDGEGEALIHTGVPAIELAIDEYLKKYAYTAKVKTAVDTFKKKVEEKDMHAKMIAAIQNNEDARNSINQQLIMLKKQLEEGQTGTNFRNEIQALDMMTEADKRIQVLRSKINKIAKNSNTKKQMTMLEVSQMMGNLDRKIRELQSDVRTELENIIEDVIHQGGQDIIGRYKNQMHSLISSGDLQANNYSETCSIDFLEETIPDAQELINQYKYIDSVDTGEREEVKNESHKWWDFLELFEPRTVTRKIFQDVEMVDVEIVYDEYISPIIEGFFKNLENARTTAKSEADKFKAFFLKELDSLEDALKKKVEENEKLTRDQQSIDKKIKEDQEKIEWLDDFIGKLDNILSI